MSPKAIALSSIVVYELKVGNARSSSPNKRSSQLKSLLDAVSFFRSPMTSRKPALEQGVALLGKFIERSLKAWVSNEKKISRCGEVVQDQLEKVLQDPQDGSQGGRCSWIIGFFKGISAQN